MTKPIIIKVSNIGFVDLFEFEPLIDISKVKSYEIKDLGDGTLSLTFYNDKGKIVKPRKKSK